MWTPDIEIENKYETVKVTKVKRLDTCYSAAYLSQTQEQQRLTISEIAADWHELMIPHCITRSSVPAITDN